MLVQKNFLSASELFRERAGTIRGATRTQSSGTTKKKKKAKSLSKLFFFFVCFFVSQNQGLELKIKVLCLEKSKRSSLNI